MLKVKHPEPVLKVLCALFGLTLLAQLYGIMGGKDPLEDLESTLRETKGAVAVQPVKAEAAEEKGGAGKKEGRWRRVRRRREPRTREGLRASAWSGSGGVPRESAG